MEEVGLARAVGTDCSTREGAVKTDQEANASTAVQPWRRPTYDVNLGAEGLRDGLVLVGLEALDDHLRRSGGEALSRLKQACSAAPWMPKPLNPALPA